MSDAMVDPRYGLYPTLDDLIYRVGSRLCADGEFEGDALYRVWIEEGQDVQSIADSLGTTLARLRYLMYFYGVGTPRRRGKREAVRKIQELIDYGYEILDIARQLGMKQAKVAEYVKAYDLSVISS